jgi:hypothetical protein
MKKVLKVLLLISFVATESTAFALRTNKRFSGRKPVVTQFFAPVVTQSETKSVTPADSTDPVEIATEEPGFVSKTWAWIKAHPITSIVGAAALAGAASEAQFKDGSWIPGKRTNGGAFTKMARFVSEYVKST